MANDVVVVGESGTLAIRAAATNGGPPMEFRSASFKGTVDERRVIVVFMTVPSVPADLTLRFEFTDPGFAEVDRMGVPTKLSEHKEVEPYREPRATRRLDESR